MEVIPARIEIFNDGELFASIELFDNETVKVNIDKVIDLNEWRELAVNIEYAIRQILQIERKDSDNAN